MLSYTRQGPGMEAAGGKKKSSSEKDGKGLMAPITPGLVPKAKQRFDRGEFTEGKFRRKAGVFREPALGGIWEWRDAVGAGIHSSGGDRSNSPQNVSQSHILWLKRKGIQAEPRISLVPVNSKEKFQRKRK